jgi:hypothetical protein
MLFPIGPPIKHTRIVLSFGIAVPFFAALGGLAALGNHASLRVGLIAGAVVGAFFGLIFSGLAPGLVGAIFGPKDEDAAE